MQSPSPTLAPAPRQTWEANRGAETNRLQPSDRPIHDWYRFVLSYPPHLVREYLDRFEIGPGQRILDPFCGTGTTLVEAKKRGVQSVGIEAHPLTHFAAATKLDWSPAPSGLTQAASRIGDWVEQRLHEAGIIDDSQSSLVMERNGDPRLETLPDEKNALLLKNSISPLPLHKSLVLLAGIEKFGGRFQSHLRVALARELVSSISNLHFGPEVGVGKPKADAPVLSAWKNRVAAFADDLRSLSESPPTDAVAHHADSRDLKDLIEPASIDAVITSPPYPNEKDYTRTTRLESVLLGFLNDKAELQALKKGMLLRSNTRNVYKIDTDDQWVANHTEIQRISQAIEARRIELGKTSGFERLYARVTRLYFGGMVRHLADLRSYLKPGARLAYVVGDQASYLRVMIRTGQILASLAEQLGYEVVGIDLFRTRLATATGEQLREEALILRWPGKSKP
jgi:SAM-dependent methyltransferase